MRREMKHDLGTRRLDDAPRRLGIEEIGVMDPHLVGDIGDAPHRASMAGPAVSSCPAGRAIT